MANMLGGLAARLKAGIEAAAEAKERAARDAADAAARAERAQQEAVAARAAMMDELHAFAKALVHVAVKRAKGVLTLTYDGRELSFAPEGDLDLIRVTPASGPAHSMTRDSEGEWEVVMHEEAGVRRLPLEVGLEELLSAHMSLTSTVSVPAPAPTPAPAPRAAAPAPPTPEEPRRKRREPKGSPGSGVKELNNPRD